MFTPEVTQSKSDYFDHFAPSMMSTKMTNSLVSSTFLSPTPSNYSDSGSYQQSPLSIYNNYNPNYHHHHYYFHPTFQDYGYTQPQNANLAENGSSWMRKYDCESQKDYFIANTPPSECYDFEVPQRVAQSPKPSTMKLINDLDNIFLDNQSAKDQLSNNNVDAACENYCFWENENSFSEKQSKKIRKRQEKVKNGQTVKVEQKFSKRTTSEGSFEYKIIEKCEMSSRSISTSSSMHFCNNFLSNFQSLTEYI